ncbi:MAG: SpoIVB peptidase S55 domain-containing protein [Acidobacteriota bacterium]
MIPLSSLSRSFLRSTLAAALPLALLLALPAAAENETEAAGESPAGHAAPAPALRLEVPLPSRPFDILPVSQIEKGQKGYGVSVFSGSEPERFEVEVIGVWRNATPELSYVLARLSGQDLERSGILQGMSGSPVFIDDKLVGAVSFSFPFGLDPIAGITPIAVMRTLAGAEGGLGQPLEGSDQALDIRQAALAPSAPDLVPSFEEMVERSFDSSWLERHLNLLSPAASSEARRPALMWTAAGFGERARGLLAGPLGQLAPASGLPPLTGGSGSSLGGLVEDPELQPGDAVALALVRGDLSLAAHGTVTDRVGDSIVAFGHPVYSLGPVRLPMTESEVIAPISSANSSFKLSNAGRLLGVFDQDRESGAHGVLGVEPVMVPLSVRLRGVVDRDYRMELANSPLFKPTLIATTAFGALGSGSFASGYQGLDVEATFHLAGREPLQVAQSFDGNQAASNTVVYLLTFAAFLELNELEPTSIERVDITITQAPGPRGETLLSTRAEKTEMRPGETARIWLETQPFRGPKERRLLEVPLPEDLEDGRYYLMIGDGTSMDAARIAVEKRQATTFDQQLAGFREFHSRKELHVLGLAPAKGRAVAGETLPDLPPSVRSVYGDAGAPLHLRIVDEQIQQAERPIEGIHRVDLQIRRRADG